MKKTILLFVLSVIGILFSWTLQAQVTIGSNIEPDADALLDLKNTANPEASTKGLLLPRVELNSTELASPLTAHVKGMAVYNTTTKNNVSPGYYFNDGAKWIRIADESKGAWYAVTTGTVATDITQDIYQMGSVGIGTSNMDASAVINMSEVNNKGVLAPKVALTSSTDQTTILSPTTGLFVYNTGEAGLGFKGHVYWDGAEWKAIDVSTSISPEIATLECSTAVLSPSAYKKDSAFTGNLKITYTGGNGGTYSPGTSTTVNGLTFTLRSGRLEYGAGELVFSVTGTATNSNDMVLPATTSLIPFLTPSQVCSATIINQTSADIKNVAAVGYATLNTDENGVVGHAFKLSTPDGKYAVRVWFPTSTPTTRVRPNVQLYNNTGSEKTLYYNYSTVYGGVIAEAGTFTIPAAVWGGDRDTGSTWYEQTSSTSNNGYLGNEGIMDGANSGPEYRRYSWIDNSTSKVEYTVLVYAGSPDGGSTAPYNTKIFIKIEQVTAQ